MLTHHWTLGDDGTRLLASVESIAFGSVGGDTVIWVGSRGDAGYGMITLAADAMPAQAEVWVEVPRFTALSDLDLRTLDNGNQQMVGMALGPVWLRQDGTQFLWGEGMAPGDVGFSQPALFSEDGRVLFQAEAGGGVSSMRLGQGLWRDRHVLEDDGVRSVGDVVSLATITTDRSDVLLMASAFDQGLSSARINDNGRLIPNATLTPDGALPIYRPSAVETISADGDDFAILAASGSSTLSVVEVLSYGGLVAHHTLSDTTTSAFSGVTEIATVEYGGWSLVAAAGSEAGLTLLHLDHHKMLRPIETLRADAGPPVAEISDMAFSVVEDRLFLGITDRELGAVTLIDTGIDPLKRKLIGDGSHELLEGTSGADILDGRNGRDVLRGRAGDDVLYDGRGGDELFGGPGADVFILEEDGQLDRVRAFDLGTDRIDMSRYENLGHISQLEVTAMPNGAWVDYGAERLRLFNEDQTPFTAQMLADGDAFIFF